MPFGAGKGDVLGSEEEVALVVHLHMLIYLNVCPFHICLKTDLPAFERLRTRLEYCFFSFGFLGDVIDRRPSTVLDI